MKKMLHKLSLLSLLVITIKSEGNISLPYDARMQQIISKNRVTLAKVPRWITDDVYKNSVYTYGIPECVRHQIDLPLKNQIMYTDAIVYLSEQLHAKKKTYLEIGVSVGKNFLPLTETFQDSVMVSLDLEKINPTLEAFFKKGSFHKSWLSEKGVDFSMQEYLANNNNTIYYTKGDVFDESSWAALEGFKFNIIFSDACHMPFALLHEFDMIEKYKLLDDEEFLMVWDDLGGQMTESFMKIAERIEKAYPNEVILKSVIQMNGWLGIECIHNVGFIMKVRK